MNDSTIKILRLKACAEKHPLVAETKFSNEFSAIHMTFVPVKFNEVVVGGLHAVVTEDGVVMRQRDFEAHNRHPHALAWGAMCSPGAYYAYSSFLALSIDSPRAEYDAMINSLYSHFATLTDGNIAYFLPGAMNCPTCNRPLYRKGIRIGSKWYHEDCLITCGVCRRYSTSESDMAEYYGLSVCPPCYRRLKLTEGKHHEGAK